MSKPKYMKGDCIRSLDDLVLQENIFWNGRIWNRKWFMNLRNGGYMIDAKEIVQARRCTSTPGGPTGDCEKCPYWKTEQLTAEQKEKLGVDTWTSCDIDKVGTDAADLIERLTAENAALREKQRWIPVTERLPEEREAVIILLKDGQVFRGEIRKRIALPEWWYFYDASDTDMDMLGVMYPLFNDGLWLHENPVVAWMPLPEAPEEGEKA